MRRLRGEPDREPSVVAHDRGRRARLERARGHPLAHEVTRDDGFAALEEVVVAVRLVDARADVRARIGEEEDLVLGRLGRIDDGGKRVVVDVDELGGIGALRPRLGQDHGDDVAREANDVLREERPPHALLDARERRRAEGSELDVGRGEHLRAGQGQRGFGIDADHACVTERRADEGRLQSPRQ